MRLHNSIIWEKNSTWSQILDNFYSYRTNFYSTMLYRNIWPRFEFLNVLPGTCLCCCHGSTPPPLSGYGIEWKKCCAAPCCVRPATTTTASRMSGWAHLLEQSFISSQSTHSKKNTNLKINKTRSFHNCKTKSCYVKCGSSMSQWAHDGKTRLKLFFFTSSSLCPDLWMQTRTHTHTLIQQRMTDHTHQSSCWVIHPLAHLGKTRESQEGKEFFTLIKNTANTHVPCCPVACWGCAPRWAWHRWPWPFGTERSDSFCAPGLRLEENHCTCGKTKHRTEIRTSHPN